MVSKDLLVHLFIQRVNVLSAENGLSKDEESRIVETFKKAMEDPFLDERRIYAKLTGKEQV
jgi:hypothetical protein